VFCVFFRLLVSRPASCVEHLHNQEDRRSNSSASATRAMHVGARRLNVLQPCCPFDEVVWRVTPGEAPVLWHWSCLQPYSIQQCASNTAPAKAQSCAPTTCSAPPWYFSKSLRQLAEVPAGVPSHAGSIGYLAIPLHFHGGKNPIVLNWEMKQLSDLHGHVSNEPDAASLQRFNWSGPPPEHETF